ncbi:MAG TPA: hypothetical protein VNX28_09850 [Gemmataceae bacterium]|nr:hypothetical protein [Gemmataceae bacterium]
MVFTPVAAILEKRATGPIVAGAGFLVRAAVRQRCPQGCLPRTRAGPIPGTAAGPA